MRAFSSLCITTALAALVYASPLAVLPTRDNSTLLVRADSCGEVGSKQYCAGTVFKDERYLCGDERLGPVALPSKSPLNKLVASYRRFGDLCPGQFLQKWQEGGKWKYPEHDGFNLGPTGQPIEHAEKLAVGTLVDRFGSERGKYLAPAGTSYAQRAIPPSSLNTFDKAVPYNYYKYEVVKPLDVLAGPVRPWFEQKGLGVQYQLSVEVSRLLNDGYLRRVETCCVNCTTNSCFDL